MNTGALIVAKEEPESF